MRLGTYKKISLNSCYDTFKLMEGIEQPNQVLESHFGVTVAIK